MSSEKLPPGSIVFGEQNTSITIGDPENESKKPLVENDINLLGEGFLTPDAEKDQEISQLTSAAAGIISGAIKIPQGIVSLTAEIMDAGAGQFLKCTIIKR